LKAILYVTPKPEQYKVTIYLYSDDGKLVENSVYDGIKHIVIEECTVRLSSQIVYDEVSLVVDAEKIAVNKRGESVLVIRGAGKG
jgi:hypothetical protein